MTDRQLLEDAARAAGKWPQDFQLGDDNAPLWYDERGFLLARGTGWWNPCDDDSDALRLAVKLSLDVVFYETGGINRACKLAFVESASSWAPSVREENVSDPYAATRRVIVRAAAAIGAQR